MDYKLPKRIENSNKATYGRVLNIAGSDYMPGAAYLSSVSALKVGCGYCFLASTERVIDSVAAQTQNVVFVPLKNIKEQMMLADVIEIGCGLSQDDLAADVFSMVICSADIQKPLVIDADGLNLLAKCNKMYFNRKFEKVILTPHPKEASRLLGVNIEQILSDIEGAAIAISKKYNAVTVLKTHKTVVSSSDGKKYINTTGNNSMAKAGSGDVLSGIIAGLLAQGKDVYEAAVLGVYLHGLCGDLAAEKLTKYSVMADDLISFIPNAIKIILDN